MEISDWSFVSCCRSEATKQPMTHGRRNLRSDLPDGPLGAAEGGPPLGHQPQQKPSPRRHTNAVLSRTDSGFILYITHNQVFAACLSL